jgi:hypothetical protein
MGRAILACVVAACSFRPHAVPDGGVDAATIDTSDGSVCVGSGPFQICVKPPLPTNMLHLSGDFDTDNPPSATPCSQPTAIEGAWTTAGHPAYCMVIAQHVVITPNFTPHGGMHAFVVVATDGIMISGRVDSSSHRSPANYKGAGAALGFGCGPLQQAEISNGGGAGGSFMTAGGDGGDGNLINSATGQAAQADAAAPTKLRAGCSGEDGDNPGGLGGGALYFAAGKLIALADNTTIDASGTGGAGGTNAGNGAGGGGSGGMIVLDAPMITTGTGVVVMANGGGGGAGANTVDGMDGADPVGPAIPASGGNNNAAGGNGFARGLAATAGRAFSNMGGGGGGGGGGGYVYASHPLGTAIVSP